jgi:hypothetical protein
MKDSAFLSKFLNEIPEVPVNKDVIIIPGASRQHCAMHAAKLQIKGSSNYIFKLPTTGKVSLHENPFLPEVREFTKSPAFIGLTKNLEIIRENIGHRELVVILNEITDTPYKTTGSLKNASEEVKGPFSKIITEIKKSSTLQQRRDVTNFVTSSVILGNLPKEALLANQEIETLEILNDPAHSIYKKNTESPALLKNESLAIQVTEASALKQGESYFRSLGDFLTIERSSVGYYKINYQLREEVHIECKNSTEKNVNEIYGEKGKLKKVDKLILQKGQFFLAWLNTETKEFTITQHFGAEKEAQKEVFKNKKFRRKQSYWISKALIKKKKKRIR